MRGRADDQPVMFHVFDVEDRIRAGPVLNLVSEGGIGYSLVLFFYGDSQAWTR